MSLAGCGSASGPGGPASSVPATPSPIASASIGTTAGPSTPPPASLRPSAAPTLSIGPTFTPAATAALGWQSRTDIAAGPTAREDHTWTADDSSAVAYLFGGRDDNGPSDELWRFDLTADSWAIVEPAGARPTARFGHTATWVPDVGLVVWSGQGASFFSDMWAFDPVANAWRELPALGAMPEARYGSCASLGPDGRLWISHGFTEDDGRFADTRAYDFVTGEWADMTPEGDVPVKRCLHDCYWSAAGDRLVLYGGQTTGTPALGDVWAYDLAAARWIAGPQAAADPRQLYALAVIGQKAVVIGGGSLERGYLDDAWLMDSASLELELAGVSATPPARSGATLISDAERGRLLLYGGQDADGLLADLWELGGPF